jgi:putative endonuclease
MTMSYWAYILQSTTTSRYYCGHTADLDRRLRQHNDPDYHGSKTTKRFEGPWVSVWSQEAESRSEAMKLEKQIKKRGMQRFLQKLQLVELR